jgi:hypothetical protein
MRGGVGGDKRGAMGERRGVRWEIGEISRGSLVGGGRTRLDEGGEGPQWGVGWGSGWGRECLGWWVGRRVFWGMELTAS